MGKGGHGGHGHSQDGDKHAGYGWLAICAIGMLCSLTFYGIVLEYATSGGRKIHEVSFLFITTSIYALTGFVAREMNGDKPMDLSRYQTLILSLTSITSTFTSVRSLRYVIFPVQILFKSCKPVPVMIFGVIMGKRYSTQKYVNVAIITAGVGLFMGGGTSTAKPGSSDNTLIGALLLSISLCFDGATGAYEDKLMTDHAISPFDLMFNIQLGKSVLSFCALVVLNGLNEFIATINEGGLSLVALGFTGAIGQIFLFLTISKFGALNCALLGLLRKMLSLILSFLLYGHTLNAIQTVGLALALASMIANFYERKDKGGHGHGHGGNKAVESDRQEASQDENSALLGPPGDVEEGEENGQSHGGNTSPRVGIELTALKESVRGASKSSIPSMPHQEEEKDMIDLSPDLIDLSANQATTSSAPGKASKDTIV